jgi:GTPase
VPGLDEGAAVELRVSAVTGEGLPVLTGRLADLVREARDTQPVTEAFVVHRPVAEGFTIEREDDGSFRVIGREVERAVALSDLTNIEALEVARGRLRRLGLEKALLRAGADEGDVVHIGGLSFDFTPEESLR